MGERPVASNAGSCAHRVGTDNVRAAVGFQNSGEEVTTAGAETIHQNEERFVIRVIAFASFRHDIA